jgi:hypothetical protein
VNNKINKQMKKIKAYKVFDSNFKCKDYQFEVGKEYEEKDAIACQIGFHACIDINDCWSYYSFNSENRVAIVELWGKIDDSEKDKICATNIKIVKELTWQEVLNFCNTGKNNTGYRNSGDWNSGDRNSGNSNSGDRNSGYRNSGDWNSGYRNSGDSNSGDRNSGYRNSGYRNSGNRNSGYSNSGYSNSGDRNSGNSNSGDWNSTDKEAGYFNSKQSKYIRVFNKKCKLEDWENYNKPRFIYNIILNEWIYWSNMSDEEKEEHPKAYVCEGYLKRYDYKEAWQNAYNKASKEDIELLKALPNFSSTVFKEITGIKI